MDAKTWKSEHTERGEGGARAKQKGAHFKDGGGWEHSDSNGGCVEMELLMLGLASESSLERLQSISR